MVVNRRSEVIVCLIRWEGAVTVSHLADSSKFERKKIIYITDPKLPGELVQIYRDNGLRVITGRKTA